MQRLNDSFSPTFKQALVRGLFGVFVAYLLVVVAIDSYSFAYSPRENRLLLLAVLPFSLTPAPRALEMKQECKAHVLKLLQQDATFVMDLVLKFSTTQVSVAAPTNKTQLGELSQRLSLAFEPLTLTSLGVQTNMFDTSIHSCLHYHYLPFCPNAKPLVKTYCKMKGPSTCRLISHPVFVAAINPPIHDDDDELTVFYSATSNRLSQVYSKRYYNENMPSNNAMWTVQYDTRELFAFTAKYYSPTFKDAFGMGAQVYATVRLDSIPSVKMYLQENECS